VSEYEHNEHLLDEIQRLRESNFHLRKDCEEQKQRIKRLEDARTVAAANSLANMISYENAITKIKRLEEAGNKAIENSYYPDRVKVWNEAKEAKP
jgi:uncharacterized Zn finger protein (UPF0148 family)